MRESAVALSAATGAGLRVANVRRPADCAHPYYSLRAAGALRCGHAQHRVRTTLRHLRPACCCCGIYSCPACQCRCPIRLTEDLSVIPAYASGNRMEHAFVTHQLGSTCLVLCGSEGTLVGSQCTGRSAAPQGARGM